ncbi:PorT family protein [Reichenbachiella carrageenanivorans]|uniref:PorT family protein n=1 Tax=Reichenbachiella carrageenanivorans TaxID=2979869 RepID=A0ABY6D3V0_9BACT|nr:porin family protein [Reichenbachiella carrageenanivorans]UXX80837.1 PorT family protein [Reichenbachiella carrageenanivorans]
MKAIKITVTLIFIGLLVHTSKAQSESGVKGGVNFSSLIQNEIEDENMRMGWHAGFYSKMELSPSLFIMPELLFSTKGTSVEYGIGGSTGQTNLGIYYIDVPVLLGINLTDQLALHLGPYVSYLVDTKIETKGDFGSDQVDVDRDHLKSFDYGLSGGLALDFGAAAVGARYNYGLTKLADSDGAELVIGDSQNAVGQIYISYQLSKK